MEKNHQGLSVGHLTMITLGSVIGGSFFLGTAVAFNAAGPSVLICYVLAGILIYFILYALSELTVANPHSGSFRTFAANYLGPGTGFVVGWVYWIGMILSMSSEATAVSILMRNWLPKVSISLLGSSIIIIVTLLNLLGARKISKLASGLSAVKLLAIVFFIIISLLLVLGVFPGTSSIGIGELAKEPFMAGGIKGVGGSMLIVMFAYAGFEIIGLAASETANPETVIPKAIRNTVLALVGLYILSALALLPLIPTSTLNENTSPMVAALSRWGMGWASTVMNLVLMTAILSASLSSMFGIGRMIRSIADEGHAPKWLEDKSDVPYRGMIFSGFIMLLSLWFGLLFPRVYLFLVSSSGFALLFTYGVIMAVHIKFRKIHGCPPEGRCQMPGFPYTSWFALIGIIIAILSMPFISGQGSGLVAGIVMVAVFAAVYMVMKYLSKSQVKNVTNRRLKINRGASNLVTEFSKELVEETDEKDKINRNRQS